MTEFVNIEYLDNFKYGEIKKQTIGSSGYDLYACIDEPIILSPSAIKIIPSGIKINMRKGIEAQIRSRSGLSTKGIIAINAPGTIDSDFRDEIGVIIINLKKYTKYYIYPGMRIAQIVFCPVLDIKLVKVDTIDISNDRGGGFGSTGV